MVTDRNLKPKEYPMGRSDTAEECINKIKNEMPNAVGMRWIYVLLEDWPENKGCFATFNVTRREDIDTTKRCYLCNFKGKKSTA